MVTRGSLRVQQQDGSTTGVNILLGHAINSWYTKDTMELIIKKFSKTSHGQMNFDYAVCATTFRNWNNPPPHGFSKEKLYLTDDTRIGFGFTCDESFIRFKAKTWCNETVTRSARQSPSGQQCMLDIASGMK